MRRAEPATSRKAKPFCLYYYRLFLRLGGGIKKDHGCARRKRRTRSGRSPRTQTHRHSIFLLCSCSPTDDIGVDFFQVVDRDAGVICVDSKDS